MKEVKEFSEYLRDEVFSNKENYSAMMENWGQEPYVMRLANVHSNSPLSLVKNTGCQEEDPEEYGEVYGEKMDDDDEELSAGDLIDAHAERLFKEIFFLIGDLKMTLIDSDSTGCRMEIPEERKGLMADTIISFFANFIFSGARLILNVMDREDNSCSVYGFRSDGLDWYPLTKMEMEAVHEKYAVTGTPWPSVQNTVFRQLKK